MVILFCQLIGMSLIVLARQAQAINQIYSDLLGRHSSCKIAQFLWLSGQAGTSWEKLGSGFRENEEMESKRENRKEMEREWENGEREREMERDTGFNCCTEKDSKNQVSEWILGLKLEKGKPKSTFPFCLLFIFPQSGTSSMRTRRSKKRQIIMGETNETAKTL